MDLAIEHEDAHGWHILRAKGEVDLYTSPSLREELLRAIEKGEQQIAIDLEGVEFMDSSGLGALVSGLKRLREKEGDLVLVSPRDAIKRILAITGLDKVFAIHASLEELAKA